jgi:hypothetical protein
VYFLDTPILAQRLFASASDRQAVEILVAQGNCYTSRYVQEQFESTFLRGAITLHTALWDTRNVPESIRYLDRFPITHGDGVKARAVLSRLMEFHQSDGEVEQMLDTLERWIERWLMDAAFDGIDIVDATGCCLCDSVTRNEYGLYKARKMCNRRQPRPCDIEGFWAARRALLAKQAECSLDSLPTEERTQHVAKALAAAQDVIVDGESPRGRICWAALSDSVIVCESREGSILVTTNLQDFKALTRVVGGQRRAAFPAMGRTRPPPPA